MYTPPHNRQDDPDAVHAFIQAFNFATLVTCGEGGMNATHLPLNVRRDGDRTVLSGHLAKANPQWRQLAAGAEALALFAEPHGYVSPAHYEPGRWVPTWNYVAVHAYGAPRLIEDRAAVLAILGETIAATEPGYQAVLDSYPAAFVDAKLQGIVAFEVEVTRIEARWKLSQDRTAAERERITLAMRLSHDPSAQRLAAFMG